MKIQVAVCQYQLVELSWDAYAQKMSSLVAEAQAKGAQVLLLPEYAGLEFGRGDDDQSLFASLQVHLPAYQTLFSHLARRHGLYILAGTLPTASEEPNLYYNRAYFFAPEGGIGFQDKLQLTAYEKASQLFRPGSAQTVFATRFGSIAVAICYDAEFPEIVRALTVHSPLILVPSYTASLAAYYRVTLSCRARAIENQCFVAVSGVVGSGFADRCYAGAALFGPADLGFPKSGVLGKLARDKPGLVSAALNMSKLARVRQMGEVHNYADFTRQKEPFVPSIADLF